ncbi:MAG: UTP--glucose-1-phosphate uridylyltransferase [Marivibrio sp.]|uniref:UTP--glucose-1-phosphate uridylyltransferase n=1 Tax=Marivibrio sp. TaxID=2039719 RepID=UPI0032EF87D6
MPNAPIRTAVFPVAGYGTRFLPATKAMAKEMLTVVDKPLIQYGLEEAMAAGITRFVLVTGRGKQAIEDHFDLAYELQATLKARGKEAAVAEITDYLPPPGAIHYVRQREALGLGHAVWCARELAGEAPFAVVSPDDLVLSRTACLKQLVDAYETLGGNLTAVMDVPRADTARYGVLATPDPDSRTPRVDGLVEKPAPEAAPSTLSIIGRYILQPEIFEELGRHERSVGGEIQLTDAMAALIGRQPFHGLRFEGERFDCGTKDGWLAANIAYALADPARRAAAAATVRRFAAELDRD